MQRQDLLWPDQEPTRGYCFVTMVKDEEPYLLQWISHYLREMDEAAFVIIDHGSRPSVRSFMQATFPGANVSVITLPPFPFDDFYKSQALSAVAALCLGGYATVVATDVDELLVPLSGAAAGPALAEVIDRCTAPFTAPVGIDFIQNTATEAPFDFSRPLLAQRDYCCFSSSYCKPCIWKGAVSTFGAGQHRIPDPFDFDERIGLAHLKLVDEETSLIRQKQRNATEFSEARDPDHARWWQKEPGIDWSGDSAFASIAARDSFDGGRTLLAGFLSELRASRQDGANHRLGLRTAMVRYSDFLRP